MVLQPERVRDLRGPGGRRLLRLEAWKAATLEASLMMEDLTGCLVARRAARAVWRSRLGRSAEAMAARKNWSGGSDDDVDIVADGGNDCVGRVLVRCVQRSVTARTASRRAGSSGWSGTGAAGG